MALGYLDSSKLTDIANSIRSKTGSSNQMTVDQMPSEIRAIPSPIAEKDINFYDWQGTLLYSYTLAEARALQELPELPPDFKDYHADSWTETLEFINSLTYPWMVGVNYTTERQATKIYITVPDWDIELGYDTTVWINPTGTSEVDWGDGTVETITRVVQSWNPASHTYAQPGDYVITISGTDFSSDGPSHPFIASARRYDQLGTMQVSPQTDTLVTMVEFGTRGYIRSRGFSGQKNLTKVIIPQNCGMNMNTESAFSYTGIEFLSVPDSGNHMGGIFSYMKRLKRAIFPSKKFSQEMTYLYYESSVEYINWPKTMDFSIYGNKISDYCFYKCTGLKTTVWIPEGITSIGTSAFYQATGITLGPLPSTLQTIENAGLQDCGSYPVLRIPASVTSLQNYSLSGSFNDVIFYSGTPPTLSSKNVFALMPSFFNGCIYVPDGMKATYVAASSYWAEYEDKIFELNPA